MQETRKFIFTVLLWATLAANPVLVNKIASSTISDSDRIVATVGHILKEDGTGDAYWEQVGIVGIAVGAVTTKKINNAATTPPKSAHVIDIVPIDAAPQKNIRFFLD